MKNRSKKQPALPSVSKVRLTAYVAAGAATAVGGATTAEATIHYFSVGEVFNAAPGGSQVDYFPLAGAANFGMLHSRSSSGGGVSKFGIFGGVAQAFNGFSANSFPYVSRLTMGANIAGLPFAAAAVGTMAFLGGYSNSQWLSAGTGFIGFRFNLGSGLQYGWASVTVNGTAAGNTFTLNGYAYGDIGDIVTAGQIPEPGSLALLAIGGAGLLAWRQRRAQAAA